MTRTYPLPMMLIFPPSIEEAKMNIGEPGG